MKMIKKLIFLCLLVVLFLPSGIIYAQEITEPPTYIVQPGDTLVIIARRFGISINDIIAENQLADPNTIAIGSELRIPGLEGIEGRLTSTVVPLGYTFQELLLSRQLPQKQFVKLNRITSPAEIVAGVTLLLPEIAESDLYQPYNFLSEGQSTLELALLANKNPWTLLTENQRQGSWEILASEQIFAPASSLDAVQNPVSPYIQSIEITPLPLVQGQTAVVKIRATQALSLSGSLAGHSLNFFETKEGEYAAIQGIYVRQSPGPAEFEVQMQGQSGQPDGYAQYVLVESGNFGKDASINIDPATIDPAITEPEDELMLSLITPATPVQWWSGAFSPLTDEPCINAPFGTERSYNNGAYLYFHTGVDFGVCAQNLNIYAPAPGTVVFAGPLNVRGNATVIDHGHGIYSGIWHQSELLVQTGDSVTTGMQIGSIGTTGRSTGPHLHWEVWAGGVQVNPLDWLTTAFP